MHCISISMYKFEICEGDIHTMKQKFFQIQAQSFKLSDLLSIPSTPFPFVCLFQGYSTSKSIPNSTSLLLNAHHSKRVHFCQTLVSSSSLDLPSDDEYFTRSKASISAISLHGPSVFLGSESVECPLTDHGDGHYQ